MQRLIQHLAHLALILLACNVDSALCWTLDRNATLGDGNSLSLTARTSQLAQDPGKPLSDQNSKVRYDYIYQCYSRRLGGVIRAAIPALYARYSGLWLLRNDRPY